MANLGERNRSRCTVVATGVLSLSDKYIQRLMDMFFTIDLLIGNVVKVSLSSHNF
jgi:hypothetical protein